MRKFDQIISRLLLEAEDLEGMPDKAPSGGEENSELNSDEDPQLGDEEEITSPEEFELAKLAVRALFFDPSDKKVNPKIYDDFEEKKNILAILGHVENIINKSESDEGFRVKERITNSQNRGVEDSNIKGKNIVDKLKYFNKNQPENSLNQGRRIFWTRIILNALKYNGNNYNLIEDDISPESIKNVFDKLKADFNHDTRGVYRSFGDTTGPGVF